MKVITLVENTSHFPDIKAMHGLCLYIETQQHKILFDLGADRLFLENARKLNVDIGAVDTVIISHGHSDHGGALDLFLEHNKTAKVYIQESAFDSHYASLLGLKFSVGLDKKLKNHPQIIFADQHHIIDEELQLFAGVTERILFSTANDRLYSKINRKFVKDTFDHEQNLIISENDRSMLIAGCAHSGIINIINKAEKILAKPVDYSISGMHLYNPASKKTEKEDVILQIAAHLKLRTTKFYTCHCTGLKAYLMLAREMGEQVEYLGSGDGFTVSHGTRADFRAGI